MIQVLLLLAWALSGLASGALLPQSGSRLGWAPLAIVFGPLWAAIVSEQSSTYQPALAPNRRT